MAGGMDLGTTSRGGKKPLDAAINLVPFIDLMAVTISFLIMTAVWTQVGRISVSQSGGVPNENPSEPAIVLEAHLSAKAIALRQGGQTVGEIALGDGKEKVQTLLKTFKQTFPTSEQVTLTVDDDVEYDRVVGFIDLCIGAGLVSVSVSG